MTITWSLGFFHPIIYSDFNGFIFIELHSPKINTYPQIKSIIQLLADAL